MGWTYQYKPIGMSMREFFDREFGPDKEGNSRIVDIATVRLSTVYIAFKVIDGVAALVCKVHFSKGEYNFGYKDMDETMGPNERECPERILKLLTSPATGHAIGWREDCWKNIHDKKSGVKPEVGMWVVFPKPTLFGDDRTYERLKIIKTRPLRLSDGRYRTYKISRDLLNRSTLTKEGD